MAVQCVIFVYICLYSFYTGDFQVQGVIPTATLARRTQSMRPLVMRKTDFSLNTQTRSSSITSSSADSIVELKSTDSQPFPSTSTGIRISDTGMREVNLHPVVEKARHVGSHHVNLPNLNEASAGTHRNGEINPARDGLYARVKSAFLHFGSAAAVGSAIGGAVIGERIIQNMTLFDAGKTTAQVNVTKAAALINDVDGVNTPI